MDADGYEQEAQRIGAEINRLRGLRDAQVEDSSRWHFFQAQINQLTDSLLAWQDDVPRARELDDVIAKREKALDHADRAVDWAPGSYSRGGAFLAAVGGVTLLISLIDGVSLWVRAVSIGLLLAAFACGWASIRARQAAASSVDARERELVEAREQRAALLPAPLERNVEPW